MKSSISRRLPTMLSIAFGEAGWRHPEGRFNIEPVCCSCSGRLEVKGGHRTNSVGRSLIPG